MLCFTAHPDDIDFGAAGTIAAWTAAGVQVSYCIMTDGDAGGFDPDAARRNRPAADRGTAARRRPRRRHRHPLPARARRLPRTLARGHPGGGAADPRDPSRRRARHAPGTELEPDPEEPPGPPGGGGGRDPGGLSRRWRTPSPTRNWPRPGWRPTSCPGCGSIAGPEERENHFVDVTGPRRAQARGHPRPRQPAPRRRGHGTHGPGPDAAPPRNAADCRPGRSAEAFHVVAVNGPETIAGF